MAAPSDSGISRIDGKLLAEYGRTAGFLTNAVTRSGAEDWHGLGTSIFPTTPWMRTRRCETPGFGRIAPRWRTSSADAAEGGLRRRAVRRRARKPGSVFVHRRGLPEKPQFRLSCQGDASDCRISEWRAEQFAPEFQRPATLLSTCASSRVLLLLHCHPRDEPAGVHRPETRVGTDRLHSRSEPPPDAARRAVAALSAGLHLEPIRGFRVRPGGQQRFGRSRLDGQGRQIQ